MKGCRYRWSFALAGLLALASGWPHAGGQGQPSPQPKNPQPQNPQPKNIPTVSIAFRNEHDSAVIVQGHSIINGMQRRGQPILVQPGKSSFDNLVPVGIRFITVFDANRPSRVLLQPFAVRVQGDLQVLIRTAPNSPQRVILTPDNGQ